MTKSIDQAQKRSAISTQNYSVVPGSDRMLRPDPSCPRAVDGGTVPSPDESQS